MRIPKGKCANCGAFSPTVKKQGHTKLFKVLGGGGGMFGCGMVRREEEEAGPLVARQGLFISLLTPRSPTPPRP